LLIEENIKLAKVPSNLFTTQKYPRKYLLRYAACRCKDPVTEQLKFPFRRVTIQHTADNFLLGEL
jgi:hypothetical protein